MINIITKSDLLEELLSENVKYIRTPFKRYETVIAYEGGISEDIKDIIVNIDECALDDNGVIYSKFTKTPIGMDKLSNGCKTTIYVYFRTKVLNENEIINITECGSNAIEYILKKYNDSDLTLYLGHLEFPMGLRCTFKVNGNLIMNTDDIFK